LPARQIRSVAACRPRCPAVQALCGDGTERPTPRPQQAARQRARYSGKKKRHPLKNILGHEAAKRIVRLGETQGGRVHDYPLLPERGGLPHLPESRRLWVDRGCQGLEPAAPPLQVFPPSQQPRGASLPPWAQGLNRLVATVRVRAAHASAGIQRVRGRTEVYRKGRKNREDHLRGVGGGLWHRQLQQA
jgi:DDE superfamily endonuclease